MGSIRSSASPPVSTALLMKQIDHSSDYSPFAGSGLDRWCSPVGQGGVLFDLVLNQGHRHCGRVEHFGGGRAKVAQDIVATIA